MNRSANTQKERSQGLFSSCRVPQAALNSSWCHYALADGVKSGRRRGLDAVWCGRAEASAIRQVRPRCFDGTLGDHLENLGAPHRALVLPKYLDI